jgi:hypothetical protein
MGINKNDEFSFISNSELELELALKNYNVTSFCKINDIYFITIKNDYKFENNNKKTINRNVSYSSAIASKARIKLHKCIKEVEKDGGRVLYCDTDSVFAAYKNNEKRVNFSNKK